MGKFTFCSCSSRVAVMVIAVFSFLNFMLESIAIFVAGEEHRLVISNTSPFFYSLIAWQIFMVILSIMLFVGAYTYKIWFCVPWLLMNLLNCLYHLYVVVMLTVKIFQKFNATELEMLLIIIFYIFVLAWMGKTVFSFIQDTSRNSTKKTSEEEDQLITK